MERLEPQTRLMALLEPPIVYVFGLLALIPVIAILVSKSKKRKPKDKKSRNVKKVKPNAKQKPPEKRGSARSKLK